MLKTSRLQTSKVWTLGLILSRFLREMDFVLPGEAGNTSEGREGEEIEKERIQPKRIVVVEGGRLIYIVRDTVLREYLKGGKKGKSFLAV